MSKYIVTVDVIHATGTQSWEVEADSPQDAIDKYNKGGGDFLFEDIEVTDLAEPDINAVKLA
jgi:hypothetical protein